MASAADVNGTGGEAPSGRVKCTRQTAAGPVGARMRGAGHAEIRTWQRDDRDAIEKAPRMAKLRLGFRAKNGDFWDMGRSRERNRNWR